MTRQHAGNIGVRALVAAIAAVAVSLSVLPPAGAAPRGASGTPGQVAPSQSETGRYIVVVHPGVDPQAVANDHRVTPAHVYRTALRGFVAGASPDQAVAMQADNRVRFVEGETIQRIVAQDVPTGIDRIETDRNPAVTTDGTGTSLANFHVAVLDTGIQADHPDLNVAGGRNFTAGPVSNWEDGNGHGTHVAGTIGAIDNGIGVVGVAPGASVWSLRVCKNLCSSGDINAGIDWMTQEKTDGNIDFASANFSISSADSDNSCSSPANSTHAAMCGAVDAGIVFAMAAGNDNRLKVPYPITFSVSAIADFDGQAGGVGSPTCRSDTDDTLANFSNYGPKVKIAAPGTCILSSWKGGGYDTISGTSMATPHVTGAVALYLHANGLDPATSAAGVKGIEDAIIAAGHPQGTANHPCSYDDARTGGPLLFVNATAFGGDGKCVVDGSVFPEADAGLGTSQEPQGDWVGAYGADGYVLAAWTGTGSGGDLVNLSGVSLTVEQANRHVSTASTEERRALQSPDTSTRRASVWHHGSEVRLRLDFAQAYQGDLRLYTVDWPRAGRHQTVAVNDGATTRSLDMAPFGDGAWVLASLDVEAGASVTITVTPITNHNALLSGLFLDGTFA